MSKRAERRHHRERLLKRKRGIVRRWALRFGNWIHTYDTLKDGTWGPVYRPERAREYHEYIERAARKLLGHNKCPCKLCKRERYKRSTDREE